MDDYIYLNRFIWNKQKAEYNKQKHHLSFEQAATVFADPMAIEVYDKKNSADEDRVNVIGITQIGITACVTTTDRENLIRIISARKATTKEQELYNAENN